MTIQEFLNNLEETKNKIIAMNLPLDTRMVNPPDMGSIYEFSESTYSFTSATAYKLNDYCWYQYNCVCDKILTETENVVIVNYSYGRY